MTRKLLFVLIWSLTILVATCTNDAAAFLFQQEINFSFDLTPEFSEFLRFDDIDFSDSFYAIQKIGHFLSFALLYVLVLNWLKKKETALMATAAFALFTEILQLFFERDGRMFDAGIDVLGILLAYSICRMAAAGKASVKNSY
ncbi:VanZ family protein [Planomicrobium chinense]|uniref:VanZ family protein n=1 Tax=Planococcus chinensis TaxID=272917 RepID=UPI001CC5D274|nr:VanZ family protein [Planococcus chinensis]MBZ5200624.1 VanZ family protein [Planococcus chinensis]MCP2033490.1 VanZ family protein [Planomicrobium sp. HSC-17F08]